MRAIGIRVEPAAIHWAVVEGTRDAPTLVASEKFRAPRTYAEADSLAWYRTQIRTLIDKYSPDLLVVRYPEPFARSGNSVSGRQRSRIEGVVLEATRSKGVRAETVVLASISARMGSRSGKSYLSTNELRGLDWSGIDGLRREAILTAAANLGGNDAEDRQD